MMTIRAFYAVSLLTLVWAPSLAHSQEIDLSFTNCVTTQNDNDRLACYDQQMARAIKAKKAAGVPIPEGLAAPILWDPDTPRPPTPAPAPAAASPPPTDAKYCLSLPTAKEKVECVEKLKPAATQPATADSKGPPKRIDALDIAATPDKWEGRHLEVKSARVYWVDSKDIRIVLSENVTLFTKSLGGSDWWFFRDNCETAREALSDKCRADVQFIYLDHDTDKPNGYEKRVVLTSDTAVAIRRTQKRR